MKLVAQQAIVIERWEEDSEELERSPQSKQAQIKHYHRGVGASAQCIQHRIQITAHYEEGGDPARQSHITNS